MRRSNIDGDRDVTPRLKTAGEYCLDDDFKRLFVAAEPRPEAPLVAHQVGLETLFFQHRADRAINRDDHLESFAIAARADWDDQHILDIEVAAGV